MNASFYSSPTYMSGGGAFTIYSGSRRQRGGGFLGSLRSSLAPLGRQLRRSIAPMGRQAFRGMKTIAKKAAANKTVRNIAKKAAQQGAEILGNVAVDALTGRNVGSSIKQHTQQAAFRALVGDNVASPAPSRQSRTSNGLKQRKRSATKSKSFPARKRRRTNRLSRASLNREELF